MDENAKYLLETFPETRSALIRFFAFNTLVTIRAFAPEDQHGLVKLAADLIDAYEMCVEYEYLFSRTISSSDVSRINDAQGARVKVDGRTYELLEAARRFCQESGGAFDITIGAVGSLWNFHEGVVPDAEEVAEALEHVDWRAIELTQDEAGHYVQLTDPQTKIDLGGIAKGWIAERLLDRFAEEGISSALVDIGGNIATLGTKPDGSLWRIGIRNPELPPDHTDYAEVIEVGEASVSTSGIYERRFEDESGSYHHILDPRTGRPLETPWQAASAITSRATDAEGYSTTMLSLDTDGVRAFMDAHPEIIEVILIDSKNQTHHVQP